MFRLIKWYGDCVAPDGRATILYWAQVGYERLHLRYASRIDVQPGTETQTTWTARAGDPPSHNGDEILWRDSAAQVAATWLPTAPSYTATEFEDATGSVRWSCLAPSAVVTMTFDSGDTLTGVGYVERLEMTVPPWSIPIDVLLWGRYISANDALAWIDWRGTHRHQVVLRRGVPVHAVEIGETGIALETGERLEIEPACTIRRGSLGPNVLSAIPGLTRVLPARLVNAHEDKTLSRCRMTQDGQLLSRGFAIHEVVKW